ncbi:hypothetical protein EUTSA_v10017861mg [Eutrema salsugineum]|uniref:CCHC-type domain-containing protein n=1 Tax=Eutrema salsugineum TaxID=72664 RepID=V4M8Z1_EUTSA|nr:hypothetical protein EUTSA_v10017861mg [Eutrema salsugineum]
MDLSEFGTPFRKNLDKSTAALSTVKTTGKTSSETPDPRWPYLSRGTKKTSSPPAMSPAASLQTAKEDTHPVETTAKSFDLQASEPAENLSLDVTEQVEVSVAEGVFPSSKSADIALASQGKELHVVQAPIAPLKGAWAKKLSFSHASVPIPAASHEVQTDYWPSLSDSHAVRNRKQKISGTNAQQNPIVRMEDDLWLPWAAKMNPLSRNLYRATEPEYLEDGTPKVTIPQHVLLRGLENQKEYILGLWHVDDCLMFVASWTPEASLAIPETKTIPVWVTLKKIPNILYSIPGISHIASGLGAPMATNKPRLDPILMGEAKILVEVELTLSMVDVEYAWLPSKCSKCGRLGHKIKRCLQTGTGSQVVATTKEIVTENVLEVGIMMGSDSTSVPTDAFHSSISATVTNLEVIPSETIVLPSNESVSIDPTSTTIADEACLSVHTSKSILETIESPLLEVAQILSFPASARASVTVQRESAIQAEPCLGSIDLMTLSGKRILQERPVKPSTKAKEMDWQTIGGGGRGNRGRGKQGGRG